MPWEAGYFDQLKSACADMKNTGSRWGLGGTVAVPLCVAHRGHGGFVRGLMLAWRTRAAGGP